MSKFSSYHQFGLDDIVKLIKESQTKVVILVFTTEWLGSGIIMEEYIEEIANSNNKISVYNIDAEKSEELCAQLNVTELPTALFLKEGEVVELIPGLVAKRKILKKLEQYL